MPEEALDETTPLDGDNVHGYTSSWMTQGSFEPPLVVLRTVLDQSLGLAIFSDR